MQRALQRWSAVLLSLLGSVAIAQDAASPQDAARQIEALKAQDPEARRAAVDELARMGTRLASTAIPALVEALKDPDAEVRDRAVGTLWRMRVEVRQSTPAVVEILH